MKSWKEENLILREDLGGRADNIYIVTFKGNGNTFLKVFTSIQDIREAFEDFNNSKYFTGTEEDAKGHYFKGKNMDLTNREIYRSVFKIAKVDNDHNVGKFFRAMFDENGNVVRVGDEHWVDEGDEGFSQAAHSWYPYKRQWDATPGKLLYSKDE